MTQNVLVTGGAGYVGSHACKALAEAGYLPIVVDNMSTGHEWAVRWGPLVKGDILNRDLLASAISQYRPCAVMHFAAHAYVGESVEEPAKYYCNNVAGTLSLLEAMRAEQIDKLVFSSSCATYGRPIRTPIGEDHPQEPINPYGSSKLMVERMLSDFASAYGLRSISLRYFNAAGADPDGEIGEDHDPETHLIPLVLDAAAGFGPPVEIFGTDYDTPDGTCVRDYIHVSDLAAAHVLALRNIVEGSGAKRYNFGNGVGFSVREIITVAQRVTMRKVPFREVARRPGDPPILIADARRAEADLDWRPEHRTIEAIIATAWRWTAERKPHIAVAASA